MNRTPSRLLMRLVLVCAAAACVIGGARSVSWSSLFPGQAAPRAAPQPATQAAAAPAPAANPAPPARDDRAADPDAMLTRARQRLERFPAVDWDVDVKADALGSNVEAVLAYVRDEIAYEPYSGAMRGASGTYTARAGNATDRALLLARLLARHSIRTRFAIGTLTEAQRTQLFARTFARKGGMPLSAVPASTGDALHERLFRRARRDYDAVRAALGPRLQPVTQPTREQVLQEMNPHVWVQAELQGAWVDLDPSFANAAVGRAVAALNRTAAELPPELYQRVAIRIIADRVTNGSLSTSTLLDAGRTVIEVTDRQIAVGHVRAASSTGLGAAMAGAFGRRADEQWMPMLWIDGASAVGTRLEVDAALVTEWLEIELSWPDGRREIARRPLVDRRGANWPAAPPFDASTLQPWQRNDAGPLPLLATHNVWFSSGPHNLAEFGVAMWEMAARAAIDRAAELERAADETAPLPAASESAGETLWPFALPNFAWMVWTDHVVLPLLNDRPGIRLYADGPRIAIFSAGPEGGGRMMALPDLRRDDLRGVVETAADAPELAEKKLWFGLLQGALEHEAMTEYVVLAGGDASKVESTSSAVAAGGAMSALEEAASRKLVVSSPGARQKGFWWEVLGGSGDTRAVASLGLHGVSGKDLPPTRIKNSGRGGTFATDEYRKELEQVRRAAKRAEQEQEAIRKYQASLPKKPPLESPNAVGAPKGGSGGGEMGEYAAAFAASLLYAAAYHILSQMLVERIEMEIEHVIEWLKAGGFRQATMPFSRSPTFTSARSCADASNNGRGFSPAKPTSRRSGTCSMRVLLMVTASL